MEKLQPGQMLGPYRIIEQIGEGGMATVFKAYQASMDRNVAIKVLPSQLATSTEFTQRFQQEARIIAKLEHPHILPVFDFGESDGITYFAMRYLDAGTLSDKLKSEGPLSIRDIDRLFTQLAEALSYAHSFGIVHRDLKPSNALIDSQGNLFLTDFGIAKLLESASPRLTQTDAIMGTPAYISPEQAQATPVDQRSDIYSLGIILYEMVTGRVPYVAETPLAVILKHVSDPLPPPSSLKPDVSEAVENVVLKALAKNPNDRYPSVADFLNAWKKALDNPKSAPRRAAETIAMESPPQKSSQTYDGSSKSTVATGSKSRGWTGWAAGCVVIACIVLALGGGGYYFVNSGFMNPTSTSTAVPFPTHTPIPTLRPNHTNDHVLLEDDFSVEDIWGTLDQEDATVNYEGENLRMRVFYSNWILWSTPNGEDYQNVHIEVTAHNNDGESSTAFGILCYQQDDSDNYYYAVMTPGGEYAIAKALSGDNDLFLTNDDQWGTSNLITRDVASYRIGMDCGNGALTLYVDGHIVDSVVDETYTSGYIGLIIYSGENADSADVNFDDFLVTSLP